MNVIVANKYKEMLDSLNIDIIKSLDGEFSVDEIIETFSNLFFQRMILDITAIKGYQDLRNIQKLSVALNMSKVILILDESDDSTSAQYLSRLISLGIYNFTKNKDGILYLLDHPNSYKDVAHIHQLDNLTETIDEKIVVKSLRVLGIKNMTDHAGATSLIYMLKKQLENIYNVVAIEIDKHDFAFYNDKDMVSTTASELPRLMMKYKDKDLILIDLNSYNNEELCNDVLYLLEPSIIKLNRLLMLNKNVFKNYAGKKIILNKSLLSNKDVFDFEHEAGTKVFYNVPPLNDRVKNNEVLNPLLAKLGVLREVKNKGDNKILGLFKF